MGREERVGGESESEGRQRERRESGVREERE